MARRPRAAATEPADAERLALLARLEAVVVAQREHRLRTEAEYIADPASVRADGDARDDRLLRRLAQLSTDALAEEVEEREAALEAEQHADHWEARVTADEKRARREGGSVGGANKRAARSRYSRITQDALAWLLSDPTREVHPVVMAKALLRATRDQTLGDAEVRAMRAQEYRNADSLAKVLRRVAPWLVVAADWMRMTSAPQSVAARVAGAIVAHSSNAPLPKRQGRGRPPAAETARLSDAERDAFVAELSKLIP